MCHISKVTEMLWRSTSPEEKKPYEKLSVQVNNQRYPGYKYRSTTRSRPLTLYEFDYKSL